MRRHYTTGAVAIWKETLAIELQDGGIVLVGPQRAWRHVWRIAS
jgi:hypothetical protein